MLGCSLYYFLSCLCPTGFDFITVYLKVCLKMRCDRFDYLLPCDYLPVMKQASGEAIMQEKREHMNSLCLPNALLPPHSFYGG